MMPHVPRPYARSIMLIILVPGLLAVAAPAGMVGAVSAGPARTMPSSSGVVLQPRYSAGERYRYRAHVQRLETDILPDGTRRQSFVDIRGTAAFTVQSVDARGVAVARMSVNVTETVELITSTAPFSSTQKVPQISHSAEKATYTVKLWPDGRADTIGRARHTVDDLTFPGAYQLVLGGSIPSRPMRPNAALTLSSPSIEVVPGLPYDHPAKIPNISVRTRAATISTSPLGAVLPLDSRMSMDVTVHATVNKLPVVTHDVEKNDAKQAVTTRDGLLYSSTMADQDTMLVTFRVNGHPGALAEVVATRGAILRIA